MEKSSQTQSCSETQRVAGGADAVLLNTGRMAKYGHLLSHPLQEMRGEKKLRAQSTGDSLIICYKKDLFFFKVQSSRTQNNCDCKKFRHRAKTSGDAHFGKLRLDSFMAC